MQDYFSVCMKAIVYIFYASVQNLHELTYLLKIRFDIQLQPSHFKLLN